MKWFLFFLAFQLTVGKSVIKRLETENATTTEFVMAINGYNPTIDDDYVAVAVEAPSGYIVKFEPSASADRIHHILLYGCTMPAYQKAFWKGGATCNGPSFILYAWARNAPSLEVPKDVAFPIGNLGDPVQYIVMQIHYAHPFTGKVRDFSGVKLHLSPVKPKYLAAVYLFVSGESIPPHLDATFNNVSCSYQGSTKLYPFAFRTHTHGMGRAVSAYFKRDGKWTKIGKRNPQWPQLFQAIDHKLEINTGDFMASMCRFDSHDQDKPVSMGSMGVNEMCNFYMMFYRAADEPDPFPYGAYCGGNENPLLVATEYPEEGTTLLPPHPEWEHTAHQSAKPFGVVEKFVVRQIGKVKLGQISGMSFDNNENLVVFHRGSRIWGQYTFNGENQLTDKSPISEPTILVAKIKDDKLELVKSFGINLFYLPHGIYVDDSGYYYTTDVGSHQVIKWKLVGDELTAVFALGERFVPGSDQQHFCKPAAVAVSKKDGSIFVADGYCNNRIVKFSKNGEYITQFGTSTVPGREGTSFALGTFNLPHDIVLDEANDKIYVADRENGRVQVFHGDGTPISEMRHSEYFGNVYSVDYCPQHGVFFIPGLPTDIANEINVFGAPIGASNFQYSFKGSSGDFHRPHILRTNKDSVFVGEIEDSGGLLWRFDVDQDAKSMMSMTAGAVSSTENSVIVFLIITIAVFMGLLYYMRSHKVSINSRTPTSFFDRGSFKPLKTEDLGSDDESEDDLGISGRT